MPTSPRAFLIILSLAPIALSACFDAAGSAPEWDGFTQDSAGLEVVHNHGGALWQEGTGWSLSEELRIGVAEGVPEYMFGKISDLAMLSDGRIVVVDGIAQSLRFFDPEGRWEKTVGQAGSGPGELGNVGLSILVGPGDTLLVGDLQNRRMNRIAPDGTWLGSWPSFLPDDAGWIEKTWDYSSAGRIVSQMWFAPQMGAGESDSLDFVVDRDLSGSIGDTLAAVPTGLGVQASEGQIEYHLFAGESQSTLCPDNDLLEGRQDRYEIRRYDSGGSLEQIVRLDRATVPVTESDRATLRRWYREFYLDGGFFSPSQVDRILSAFRFAQAYPAFRNLICGPGGSIWVQPWKAVSDLTEEDVPDLVAGIPVDAAQRFDVFDRQGRYLGVVPIPSGFLPSRFRGNRLYGRWRDSLNVEYVSVLRVEATMDGTGG